jgi:hypothetical protein
LLLRLRVMEKRFRLINYLIDFIVGFGIIHGLFDIFGTWELCGFGGT